MKCTRCGGKTEVKDTRHRQENTTYRRLKCLRCGHKFSTYEITVQEHNEFMQHKYALKGFNNLLKASI